jgi:uncharacterized membrane protein
MIVTILVVLVFVISMIACHFIAKRRGADPVFWGVMGAIFGPLAITVLLVAKQERKNEKNSRLSTNGN